MSPEPTKKPPRCSCCKKTSNASLTLHTWNDKTWCNNCLYGHDDDPISQETHALRKFCSCCIMPSHGGFYNMQPVSGLCANCHERRDLCKPGGPHRSSTRGEGSPPIHQHSCNACRRWFYCDCGDGARLAEQVYCGCNGHPHPIASGTHVHQHVCGRCQDQNFRCIVDDAGARPACSNCRNDVGGFVARGTQYRSIKRGKRRSCMKIPKKKATRAQYFAIGPDGNVDRVAVDPAPVRPAEIPDWLLNIANGNGAARF